MQAKLKRLQARYPDRIRGALHFQAEKIMTRSKRDFVPVDLGALRSSGHVRPPERGKGRIIQVKLVYGGPSVPYAIVQHETPPAVFSHTVGQWKYLERPLMEAVSTLARDLAADLQLSDVSV